MGAFFRERGVDKHAGAEFEARRARDSWDDREVPVDVFGFEFVFGGGADDVVVVGVVEADVDAAQEVAKDEAEIV